MTKPRWLQYRWQRLLFVIVLWVVLSFGAPIFYIFVLLNSPQRLYIVVADQPLLWLYALLYGGVFGSAVYYIVSAKKRALLGVVLGFVCVHAISFLMMCPGLLCPGPVWTVSKPGG